VNRDWFFFDLVGTFIHGRAGIGEQYAAHARALGVPADAAALDAAFRSAMKYAPRMEFPGRAFDEIAALERDWWRKLVEGIATEAGLRELLPGGLFDEYFDRLYNHFTTIDAWLLYPDVLPTLKALKREGYGLGLITNYDTRVYLVLDALGLTDVLDSVTIPAHAGAAKPSRAVFAAALEANDLVLDGWNGDSTPEPAMGGRRSKAPAVFYVGDSLTDDYYGAINAGLAPILLDRHGRHLNDDLRRIESLDELLG
jgi:putative hydrolase of the HAD superfamily